jgi:hypothetical protein
LILSVVQFFSSDMDNQHCAISIADDGVDAESAALEGPWSRRRSRRTGPSQRTLSA